jgi:hypothetical protein
MVASLIVRFMRSTLQLVQGSWLGKSMFDIMVSAVQFEGMAAKQHLFSPYCLDIPVSIHRRRDR